MPYRLGQDVILDLSGRISKRAKGQALRHRNLRATLASSTKKTKQKKSEADDRESIEITDYVSDPLSRPPRTSIPPALQPRESRCAPLRPEDETRACEQEITREITTLRMVPQNLNPFRPEDLDELQQLIVTVVKSSTLPTSVLTSTVSSNLCNLKEASKILLHLNIVASQSRSSWLKFRESLAEENPKVLISAVLEFCQSHITLIHARQMVDAVYRESWIRWKQDTTIRHSERTLLRENFANLAIDNFGEQSWHSIADEDERSEEEEEPQNLNDRGDNLSSFRHEATRVFLGYMVHLRQLQQSSEHIDASRVEELRNFVEFSLHNVEYVPNSVGNVGKICFLLAFIDIFKLDTSIT
ncbi:hypothetical protein ACLMJK_005627 [Lecanora helva]